MTNPGVVRNSPPQPKDTWAPHPTLFGKVGNLSTKTRVLKFLMSNFAQPMQDCGYQVTHSPEGRLQLHWERATKAVHQIPRSKTPDSVTLDSCSATLVCYAQVSRFAPGLP